MELTPRTGSFGNPFPVRLVIDGHGEKFNAAQATVTLSPNLAVKDLTFGDCNFTYLRTPAIQNPSFAGGIPGKYATKCTAYTLTLVPIAKGEGTLSLAKAMIYRYPDAASILSAATGATYTLTAALKAPTLTGVQTAQNGLYTVAVTVLSGKKAVPNATVNLTAIATKTTQQKTTDAAGNIQFTNLQTGLYDVVMSKSKNKIGESIINVNGKNHTLAFSLNLEALKDNPLLKSSGSVLGAATASPYFIPSILGVGTMFGAGLAILFFKLKERRNLPV